MDQIGIACALRAGTKCMQPLLDVEPARPGPSGWRLPWPWRLCIPRQCVFIPRRGSSTHATGLLGLNVSGTKLFALAHWLFPYSIVALISLSLEDGNCCLTLIRWLQFGTMDMPYVNPFSIASNQAPSAGLLGHGHLPPLPPMPRMLPEQLPPLGSNVPYGSGAASTSAPRVQVPPSPRRLNEDPQATLVAPWI